MLISGASSFIMSRFTQLVAAISSEGGRKKKKEEKRQLSCFMHSLFSSISPFAPPLGNRAWLALPLWYFTALRFPTFTADARALTARQETRPRAAVMAGDTAAECGAKTLETKSLKGKIFFKFFINPRRTQIFIGVVYSNINSKPLQTELEQSNNRCGRSSTFNINALTWK